MRSVLVSGILLLMVVPSFGEVYWRQKHSLPPGWVRAYHVPAELSQGKGELSVYAVDGGISAALASLETMHGAAFTAFPGESAAWGLALPEGWVLRYVLCAHPREEKTLVTRVAQRERDAGAPTGRPERHQLQELPHYIGSKPSYYLKDGGTQMAVEISVTPAPAFAVLNSMRSSMESVGWLEAFPVNGGMAWYMKRGELALVSAQKSGDGTTRVLRLHKPIGVK